MEACFGWGRWEQTTSRMQMLLASHFDTDTMCDSLARLLFSINVRACAGIGSAHGQHKRARLSGHGAFCGLGGGFGLPFGIELGGVSW